MIPPAFDYALPKTLPEAVALLGQHPGAKILAGGHSLIPMLKFRLATPPVLIDINRLEGLAYIREEGDWLRIGAMTREADLERSELIRDRYPLIADTTRLIADPIVRNMATFGGNLAHADPANDHPAAVLALGGQVVAVGPAGERVIPIESFFLGPFESALAPDEILTEVRVPVPQPHSGGAYMKMERKVGDFATAAVAAQVTLDAQGVCAAAGLGLTNMGLMPIKAVAAEQALAGQPLDDAHVRQAAQLASEAAEPSSDQRGSEDYKRSLVRTLTVRALRLAAERARA
jgi:carbon-monoxide dehydrogenase medium subunit